MNRRERRAAGIKSAPPTYNLTADQLEQLRREAVNSAIGEALEVKR